MVNRIEIEAPPRLTTTGERTITKLYYKLSYSPFSPFSLLYVAFNKDYRNLELLIPLPIQSFTRPFKSYPNTQKSYAFNSVYTCLQSLASCRCVRVRVHKKHEKLLIRLPIDSAFPPAKGNVRHEWVFHLPVLLAVHNAPA